MTSTTDDPYARLVDDLAYSYEGVFSRDDIARAVANAHQTLAVNATVTHYLPVLVAKQAKEQLQSAAQADGRIAKSVP